MSSDERHNFHGRRLDCADFSDAHLHDANFENTNITDGWLRNADISGFIEGLRVNGVEVAPLVEAELDRHFPERRLLRSADPSGLAAAWMMLEGVWEKTLARAHELPEPLLFERVDGEWSFVETLRHLVMATDSWLLRMVRAEDRPYHPWGIAGPWLKDPAGFGLDVEAEPSLTEVLQVRRQRMAWVKSTIDAVTPEELERTCVPPKTPGHPTERHTVLACLHVILDEEWNHNLYANRDLDALFERNDAGKVGGEESR